MLKLQATLVFPGNCKEAMAFYEKALGAKKTSCATFGEMPANPAFPMSEDMKNLVMHASLEVDGITILFSDLRPDDAFTQGKQTSLSFNGTDKKRLQEIYEGLKEGANILVEMGPTFWSEQYAFLIDKFGVMWQINYDGAQQ